MIFTFQKYCNGQNTYSIKERPEELEDFGIDYRLPWIVYTVRESVKTYADEERKQSKTTLQFMQELLVVDENGEMLQVISDPNFKPKPDEQGFKSTASAKDMGWVEKKDLILWLYGYSVDLGKTFRDTRLYEKTRLERDTVRAILKRTQDTLRNFSSLSQKRFDSLKAVLEKTQDTLKRARDTIKNDMKISISETSNPSGGIVFTMRPATNDKRFTGVLEFSVKKPMGYNVLYDNWQRDSFSSMIKWNDAVQKKESFSYTLFPMQKFQIFFVERSDGSLNRKYVNDTIRNKLKVIKGVRDPNSDINKYFLWISNGTDKSGGLLRDDKFFEGVSNWRENVGVNIYQELQVLFEELKPGKCPECPVQNRVFPLFHFFLSKNSLNYILSEPTRFDSLLRQFNYTFQNVILYSGDDNGLYQLP